MKSWVVLLLTATFGYCQPAWLTGVNLAGAEFGENNLPGTYNQHYTYPTSAEVDYFLSKGMNIIRLPFRWERLQPATNAAFNSTELGRLQTFVTYATGKGAYVLLDPHNYARYYNTNIIGSAAAPISAFTNFWGRLATIFRNQPLIIFGLMNEPHDMPTELWRDAANAAIAAIRATGATNLIFVPGNAWTGAWTWEQSWYGMPNGTTMLSINDPANNYVFEVHQYLDSDGSGGSSTCVSTNVGVDRLRAFTAWCRRNGRRGFLGEVGVATNTTCLTALQNMLTFVHENRDIWLGWTYWAAGPWWADYHLSIEPVAGADKPQTDILQNGIPIPEPMLSVRRLPPRNDIGFTFQTRYGFVYQPQASLNLGPLSWINYGNSLTGNAQAMAASGRTSNAHQFFRVQVNRLP